MAEYQTVVQKFKNAGVVQTLDPDSLGDGMYYSLKNAVSIQEGSIASRLGSTRITSSPIGSLITSIFSFQPTTDPNHQFLYVGEGSSIVRVKLNPTLTTQVVESSLPDWHKKLSATYYTVGTAGKPHIFIAGGKMLKDPAVRHDGSLTSSMERWGIIPPPAAPQAEVGSPLEKAIYSGSGITETWTVTPDQSNQFKTLTVLGSPINLGEFQAGVASGFPENGYDSEDYIEIEVAISNPDRFNQFYLQFDVSQTANTYADYYEKVVVPFVKSTSSDVIKTTITRAQIQATGALSTELITDGYDPTRPVELPPIPVSESSPQSATIRVKKNEFLKVGKAGQPGFNWSNVKHARILAQYGTLVGGPDQTFKVLSVKLGGGSGPDNSDPGDAPYQYVYTYRNDRTGHESNPCPMMLEAKHIRNVKRRPIQLTGIVRSSDPQVTSIAIYRAGGAYTDGEFRLVGYIDNAGSGTASFVDNASDADLLYAKVCDWDNDPPVPSRLPEQMAATMTPNTAVGLQTVALSISQPSGATAAGLLTVGTRLSVQSDAGAEEVQITNISGNSISAYFQLVHRGTIRITCGTVAAMPCRFATTVGNSIYLAGDPNNPCRLYKSKSGRPESFPAVTEVTGRVNHMDVTAPPNRILGLTEFAGECIVLTRANLYVVRVFNGQMLDPVEVPAQRGVFCEFGWCKGDNAIFYLSSDGVYAWAGSRAVKISTAIDWFFRDERVNDIAPMDKSEDAMRYIAMHYHNNVVYLSCRNTDGFIVLWTYDVQFQRWSLHEAAKEGAAYSGWSAFCSAAWSSSTLYSARWFHSAGDTVAHLYRELVGNRDNGQAYPIIVHTGFYTMGAPTVQKHWGDIILEAVIPTDITVSVYTDFQYATPVETFTVVGSPGAGRRRIPLPFNSGMAKEAYAIAFRFEFQPHATERTVLHSMTFNFIPQSQIQRGRPTDWSEYGYPHDKRLDQLIIKYDTGGQPVTLNMDVTQGLAGKTRTNAIATFLLQSNGPTTSSFPIKDASGNPIVAKTIRLRPSVTSHLFQIYDAVVTYEKYPPDITLFTDPSDYGTPYDKIFQQLIIDMDTGGVPATVGVYLDNQPTPVQQFTITTTSSDRQRNLVMKTGAIGKKARLVLQPGLNGKTQLFGHTFVTLPADKGPVLHSYDWDDLGYPYDKKIISFAMEYEVQSNTQMVLEGIAGTSPSEQVPFQIMTFTLSPSGRKKLVMPVPADTVVKMIRFRPVSEQPNPDAKIYKYQFEKINYPADRTNQLEWSDLGWPCEKVIRGFTLNADTGGSVVGITMEVDGQPVAQTWTIQTTEHDRVRRFSVRSDLGNTYVIGKMVRLLFDIPANGKMQVFDVQWSAMREPCPMSFFDTFEQHFGSNGYKYVKQIWVEYRSEWPVDVFVYVDGGRLLHQETLPPSAERVAYRFYLPSSRGGALNKSKSFRIVMETDSEDKKFYLYRDSSRVEVMNLSIAARMPYYQTYLWSEMVVPA